MAEVPEEVYDPAPEGAVRGSARVLDLTLPVYWLHRQGGVLHLTSLDLRLQQQTLSSTLLDPRPGGKYFA